MSKKKERVFAINTRLNEMADVLETEKRSMTADELVEMEALKQEKEILQLRQEREEHGNQPSDTQYKREMLFAKTVHALHQRSALPEGAESFVKGGEIVIPKTRAQTKIQNTDSAKELVPFTIGDIIGPLEKGLIMDKVGTKVQYGLVGDWAYPVVAGVEATIEEENAEVSDSTIDISQLKPEPKRVAIAIPVSNTAIDESNGSLLEIVNTQMTMAIKRTLNKWMFSPEKIVTKATDGCFVEAVKAPHVVAKGAEFTYKDVTLLSGKVIATGVEVDSSAAYVCSGLTYSELLSTPRDAGSGRMIIEDGKINGYPVFVTEFIGNEYLGFGVFSYDLVGQFGEMRYIIDPYTGAKKNVVYFVLNTRFAQTALRKEAFGIAKKTTAEAGK